MAKPDQPGWASKSSNTLSLIWISPLQKGLPNCQLCPLPSFAMQHRIRTLGQLSLTPVRALHDGSVDFAWTEELKKSHWIEFSAQQDIWECPQKPKLVASWNLLIKKQPILYLMPVPVTCHNVKFAYAEYGTCVLGALSTFRAFGNHRFYTSDRTENIPHPECELRGLVQDTFGDIASCMML